jgi:UDP-arabinose 4-epimerase
VPVESVLIVGGAGYIGSHAAKAIASSGATPVVFDDLSGGHAEAVKWGPLELGTLATPARIREVIADHRITAVMHFAAHAYVRDSLNEPGRYFENNVANTIRLLDAMVAGGARSIVFSSSCAVYGEPTLVPIAEASPLRPINPYGESKLIVERLLPWYHQAHGLGWIALRYFNAAGADPEGEIGEDHDPEPHLIPRVIQAALGRGPAVEIFGLDYPTHDGTAIRDYTHVADLADAHVLALAHLERNGAPAALNLGTGQGHSVRQVIAAVERAGGRKVPLREAGRRPGDPPALIASAELAADVLGWRPRFPDLEQIVEHAWRWYSC